MSSVLVVDDASIMRMVMKDILQRYCKYEKRNIHEASDGHEAVSKYARVKPSIVLCDISMPGMNGIDVVKALMEKDPEAKIIMITASNDEADVVDCIRAGAKDYIIKPPKPERVMVAIKRITDDNPLTLQERERAEEAGHMPDVPAAETPETAEPPESPEPPESEAAEESAGEDPGGEDDDTAAGGPESAVRGSGDFTQQVKMLREQLDADK